MTTRDKKIIDKKVSDNFENFLKNSPRCQAEEEQQLLRKAFQIAYNAHNGAMRKTGDPFIVHPIEVARIVTNEIGLGVHSAVSAILHHIHEISDYIYDDFEKTFGVKVAKILSALGKVPEDSYNSLPMQAETFRNLLLTLSDDVRVVFIKLADRLHNMRTVSVLSPETQIKLANETMELYAPLAHRLGLYTIKTELEDLSFKTLKPDIYHELSNKLQKSEKKRNHLINRFAIKVSAKLDENGIKHEVTGRTKTIYSIARKIETKNVPFEEIYDILAIRIIFEAKEGVPEDMQCWQIYTILSKLFTTKQDRLRDWVSKPKENGYEALHVTVLGPTKDWVEVQIRSARMHEIAERGVAAHWKYKGINSVESQLDRWIARAREVLESPDANALDYLDKFKMTLFSPEILVFTPKGDVISLPHNSTVLDFAFAIHSDLGFQCIGAQIGKKIFPLDHALQSGDTVKILTSGKAKPKPEWLNFLITTKAKNALKTRFKELQDRPRKRGKEILQDKFIELDINPTSDLFRRLLKRFNCLNKNQLYENIGTFAIDISEIEDLLRRAQKGRLMAFWRQQVSKKFGISQKSKIGPASDNLPVDEPYYVASNCCNPIPGDEIIGYLGRNNAFILHKANCPQTEGLTNIYGDDIINAVWTTHKLVAFLTKIRIAGIDKQGIVNDITNIVSKELQIDIKAIHFDSENNLFSGVVSLYVLNIQDLNNLIIRLRKIDGVKTVERMEQITEL